MAIWVQSVELAVPELWIKMHLIAVDVVIVVDSVISDQWCRSCVFFVERRSTVRRVFDVFCWHC